MRGRTAFRLADGWTFPDVPAESYELIIRVYGADGCMGPLEPEPKALGHEIGVVIEAVADSQHLADTVCSFARSTMLHYGYPGRLSTAGNLAFPHSPSDLHGGAVYRWSIHHLMSVDDPCALFPVEYTDYPGERP
ncbi:hypothetical protein NGB36_17570 [Streptomyces sp. RB6PN25]|uniref:Uncharacterized protein n=1 Tax=Streptomyces humicola TaxID=2953240 RepID=A0ABT1PXI7_9ACTN|nr:hypothetical protein [Streptomyces humicola]MCQ4082359.1 hypothetical protein [Streptomyces humicola]